MKVNDYKNPAIYVEKAVTQDKDESNWTALQDTIIKAKPKKLFYPNQNNENKIIYSFLPVDTNTDLVLVDNDNNVIECKPDGVDVSDGTVNTLDIFGDGSCIATYNFDGDLTDLSGNYDGTAYDSDGNEVDATFDDGKFDNAISFDKSYYVDTGMTAFKASDNFTITLWFNTSDGGTLLSCNDGGDNFKYEFSAGSDGTTYARLAGDGTSTDATDKLDFDLDEWVFACFKYADDTLYYSINNGDFVSVGRTITDSDASTTMWIGTEKFNNDGYFKGLIDQVRIFNKVLTDDEIDILYNEQISKYSIDISSQNLSDAPKAVFYKTENPKLLVNQESKPTIFQDLKLDVVNTTIDSDDNDKFYVPSRPKDLIVVDKTIVKAENGEEYTDTVNVLDVFGDGSCVATYTLDGNADDLSGNYNGTWKDADGNDIDGTYEEGVFGQCAVFDDEKEIKIEQDKISGDCDITISTWVNLQKYEGQCYIVSIGNSASDYGERFCLHIDSDSDNISINRYYDKSFSLKRDILYNKFTHLVVMANKKDDGLYYSLFINGKFIEEIKDDKTNSLNIKDGNFIIAQYENTGGYSFKGLIDQVRIFNRALTPEEVQRLYYEGYTKLSQSNLNLDTIPEFAYVTKGLDDLPIASSTTTSLLTYLDTETILNKDDKIVVDGKNNVTITDITTDDEPTLDKLDVFGDGNCVATWTLDGNVDDLSGNYNGTLQGDATFVEGLFNRKCLYIDGTKSGDVFYLDLDVTDTIIISGFIKTNFSRENNPHNINFVDKNDSGSYPNSYNIGFLNDSALEIDILFDDERKSDNTITLPFKCQADKFYHIIILIVDNKFTFYIDSKKVIDSFDTTYKLSDTIANRLCIGNNINDDGVASNQTDTHIQQLRVIKNKDSLTDEEVQRLYYEDKYRMKLSFDKLDIAPTSIGLEKPIKLSNSLDMAYDSDKNTFIYKQDNLTDLNTRQLQRAVILPEKMDEITEIKSELYVKGKK